MNHVLQIHLNFSISAPVKNLWGLSWFKLIIWCTKQVKTKLLDIVIVLLILLKFERDTFNSQQSKAHEITNKLIMNNMTLKALFRGRANGLSPNMPNSGWNKIGLKIARLLFSFPYYRLKKQDRTFNRTMHETVYLYRDLY